MLELPFLQRLALLVCVLGTLAVVDHLRGGDRWRAYGILLFGAAAGGLFGAANDQLSLTLSTDYFVLGKGLAAGPGLRGRAAALGCEAGFGAGALLTGALLVRESAPYSHVLRALSRVARSAIWGGLVGALVVPLVLFALAADPLGAVEGLGGPAALRFHAAWGEHCGVYLGAVLGALHWAVTNSSHPVS